MNWVIAKFQDPSATPTAAQDAFGTASFDWTAASNRIGTAEIGMNEFVSGATLSPASIDLLNCTDGELTFDEGGGSGGTMYATSNGGMLVNPGTGVIFAAPRMKSSPTSGELNGVYSGLLFQEGSGVQPARVTIQGSSGSGAVISNLSIDQVASDGVTFTEIAAGGISPGIVRGKVNGLPLNCVFSNVENQRLLACNGASGSAVGGVYPIFFFLGVHR
jgi:hypothetical protein